MKHIPLETTRIARNPRAHLRKAVTYIPGDGTSKRADGPGRHEGKLRLQQTANVWEEPAS